MSIIKRRLPSILLFLLIFGWIVYPGWFMQYSYSNLPEQYAYPASMSGPCDPPWGFWFW
jgi:hypothetical protein